MAVVPPATDLDESNVLGVELEALTADVEAVLADETVAVAAHPAVQRKAARHEQGETGGKRETEARQSRRAWNDRKVKKGEKRATVSNSVVLAGAA